MEFEGEGDQIFWKIVTTLLYLTNIQTRFDLL